jgi:hypothetical protein
MKNGPSLFVWVALGGVGGLGGWGVGGREKEKQKIGWDEEGGDLGRCRHVGSGGFLTTAPLLETST